MAGNFEKLLKKLQEVPGYKGAGIYNVNGENVAFHAVEEAEKINKFFINMASMLVHSEKVTSKGGGGALDLLETESELGRFVAKKGKKYIAMILLEHDGNIALAKEALEEVTAEI